MKKVEMNDCMHSCSDIPEKKGQTKQSKRAAMIVQDDQKKTMKESDAMQIRRKNVQEYGDPLRYFYIVHKRRCQLCYGVLQTVCPLKAHLNIFSAFSSGLSHIMAHQT